MIDATALIYASLIAFVIGCAVGALWRSRRAH